MDDAQNRLARELADAIAAAVEHSTDVEACRERSRAAGYHLKVTLEATVGFATLPGHVFPAGAAETADEPQAFEVSANDRRFLRSLRISADEVKVEEAN